MASKRRSKKTERTSSKPAAAPAKPGTAKFTPRPATTGSRSLSVPVSRALPRTFQGRLSLAFVMVFALAVGIVSVVTVFVLDNDLRQQETTNLETRANAVAAVVRVKAEAAAARDATTVAVVSASGTLNNQVIAAIGDHGTITDYANNVAQADLRLRFGLSTQTFSGPEFKPSTPVSTFSAPLTATPGRGQARDPVSYTEVFTFTDPEGAKPTW